MPDKPRITPALPRGMRDFLPDQLAVRRRVIETLRGVFELYGFQPLETPAMERLDVLQGKYGEEGEKLSYLVLKRGAEFERALEKVKAEGLTGAEAQRELADLGLRYDLTVPLARVVAMNQGKLQMPFKRYQIAPVWRADRPQAGRYREFTQCDVDIVGTDSPVADAEIIALIVNCFDRLDLDVRVVFNDRRLLRGVAESAGIPKEQFQEFCTTLDKYDKIGRDNLVKEWQARGIKIDRPIALIEILEYDELENIDRYTKGRIKSVISEIEAIRSLATRLSRDDAIALELSLARGLDYYTSTVFEVRSEEVSIGSLGGGGRYDGLVSAFSKESIPAVGTSFGIDRIVDVLREFGLKDKKTLPTVAVLSSVPFGRQIDGSIVRMPEATKKVCEFIRNDGIPCEISYSPDAPLGKQIQLYVRRGVDYAIFLDNEMADSEALPIEIKHLATGEQRTLTLAEAVKWIKETKNKGL
ncbi:MAG: histidine--tRNA ligase [Calditrichaeota bacterium]|nr:histidine--tRNA ligase [Calditrichota bacterium]